MMDLLENLIEQKQLSRADAEHLQRKIQNGEPVDLQSEEEG